MIASERYLKILNLLAQKDTATISEISDLLGISESTVRRDLITLSKQNKLIKVHGGALAKDSFSPYKEKSLSYKKYFNQNEKLEIAKKASSLISPGDFVYLDSGSTTYHMIDFLLKQNITYVTNSISIASEMLNQNFNVLILGGIVKPNTRAVIGGVAKKMIEKFNFSIGFFGTNGISFDRGFTTPDIQEAEIKKIAIKKCDKAFVLADISKFNLVSSITFSNLEDTYIITNKLKDSKLLNKLQQYTKVLEV